MFSKISLLCSATCALYVQYSQGGPVICKDEDATDILEFKWNSMPGPVGINFHVYSNLSRVSLTVFGIAYKG